MPVLHHPERAAIQAFGREHVRPSAIERDEAALFDRRLWQKLAEQRVFRSVLDGDVVSAALALAGLAHGSLDVPFGLTAAAQWIGGRVLEEFGSPAQRSRYLDRLLSGEWIVAVCNSEHQAGTQLKLMKSRVSNEGDGGCLVSLHKSGASNLSDADVALVSAWKQGREAQSEPTIEVFVLEARAPLIQESHVQQLAGFRTGLTGALRCAEPLPLRFEETQLGADGSGSRILRLCFHLERLLIGALLVGCLDGILDECVAHLREREAHNPQFSQHQYVQEKLTLLFSLARRTEGLLSLITQELERGREESRPLPVMLEGVSDLLGVLKLTAVEDSLTAAETAYELQGYSGYQRQNLVQKAHRDLLAFKMLGGTKEQIKVALFRDLQKRWIGRPS